MIHQLKINGFGNNYIMNQGKIIEYIDQGRFICAICLQDKGSSLQLLTASNREVKLSPKRAMLFSESSLDITRNREALLNLLRQIEESRHLLTTQVNVKELWELVCDEKERFDQKYLAHLVFGKNITDDHQSSVVRAIFEDRLYFKMKDGYFTPNSAEKVEQILIQRKEEAQREAILNLGGAWLKEIHSGKNPTDPPHKQEIIKLLIQMALYGAEGVSGKYGKQLFALAGITKIQKSRDLLVHLGIWDADENLDLLRAGIETSFSDGQLADAACLSGKAVSFENREDLRDLFVFTIDGPSTLDFDDAVSFDLVDDKLLLGIHIADVAAMIPLESIVDQEARKRGSSIYLPRKQIPMIPHDLSHHALSLIQDYDRPAVSLFVNLDNDGQILDYRLSATVIRVKQKLTYDEVDAVLNSDDGTLPESLQRCPGILAQKLQKLVVISRQLQQERMNHDALRMTLPELQVVFHEDSTLSLEYDDQETPSRKIIAELMILYNCLTAKFCRDNQIPVLYRTQAEPSERLPDDESDYIYYVFKQRRKLSPVFITTKAGPHSGLGLDVYIQASSPIRRYQDLVMQRQIVNFLENTPPAYDENELDEIRTFLSPVLKEYQTIKRNRIRYWILKYLSRQKGTVYSALVLDEFRRNFRIVLCDFFLMADIGKKEGVLLRPGEEIQVKVTKADPWEDVLKLEYGAIGPGES